MSFRVLTTKSQLLLKVQKICGWQVRIIAKVKRNNTEMPGKRKSEQMKYNFLKVLHSKESIGMCLCRHISSKLTQSLIRTNTSNMSPVPMLYCLAWSGSTSHVAAILFCMKGRLIYSNISYLTETFFNRSHQPFREHHIDLGSTKICRRQISEALSKMKMFV